MHRPTSRFALYALVWASPLSGCAPSSDWTTATEPTALRIGEAELVLTWSVQTIVPVVRSSPRLVPVRGIAWLDLDGEAPLDVVSVLRGWDYPDSYGWVHPDPASFLLLSSPGNAASNLVLQDLDPNDGFGATSVSAGMLDGDEAVDLFVSMEGGAYDFYGVPLGTHLNDGHGAFLPADWFGNLTTATSGALEDVDHDGDLDIIVAGWSLTSPFESIQIYTNDGFAHFEHSFGVGAGDPRSVAARAWVDPTDPMIVSADWETVVVYDSQLAPLYSSAVERGGAVAWLQADAVPGPDFVVNDPRAGPAVWVSDGETFTKRWQATLSPCIDEWRPCGIATADLDGDGDDDFVVAGDEALALYENDGTGQFERVATTPGPWRVSAAADWDGDGDVDLAVGGTEQVVVFDNRPATP